MTGKGLKNRSAKFQSLLNRCGWSTARADKWIVLVSTTLIVKVYGQQHAASASGLVNTTKFVSLALLAGVASSDALCPSRRGFSASPAMLQHRMASAKRRKAFFVITAPLKQWGTLQTARIGKARSRELTLLWALFLHTARLGCGYGAWDAAPAPMWQIWLLQASLLVQVPVCGAPYMGITEGVRRSKS